MPANILRFRTKAELAELEAEETAKLIRASFDDAQIEAIKTELEQEANDADNT